MKPRQRPRGSRIRDRPFGGKCAAACSPRAAIGDISTKIGAVSNLESILQTAVEELGRKIGGAAEVSLEISSGEQPKDAS